MLKALKSQHKKKCGCDECLRNKISYYDEKARIYDELITLLENRKTTLEEKQSYVLDESLKLCYDTSPDTWTLLQNIFVDSGFLYVSTKTLENKEFIPKLVKRIAFLDQMIQKELQRDDKTHLCERCKALRTLEILAGSIMKDNIDRSHKTANSIQRANKMAEQLIMEEQRHKKSKKKTKKSTPATPESTIPSTITESTEPLENSTEISISPSKIEASPASSDWEIVTNKRKTKPKENSKEISKEKVEEESVKIQEEALMLAANAPEVQATDGDTELLIMSCLNFVGPLLVTQNDILEWSEEQYNPITPTEIFTNPWNTNSYRPALQTIW